MEDSYYFDNSRKYYAPPEGSLEDLRLFISNLPSEDRPTTFGLNQNADFTFQQKETEKAAAESVIPPKVNIAPSTEGL